MDTVPVTVAICTRDRPRRLDRALRSLAEQRPRPAEILVVDNAPAASDGDGADGTGAVVRRFEGVRYLREPESGLDFARNHALRHATRPIVAFLDDDAVAAPGWCGALHDTFAADPALAACTGRVEALALETEAQRAFEANGGFGRGADRIVLPDDAASRKLRGHRAPLIAWTVSIGSGCSFAVRRRAARDVGGFDVVLDRGEPLPGGGDHDMLWRLLDAGHRVAYEPAALAWHEHRREMPDAIAQLAGHQRGLLAFLVKSLARTRGTKRLPVAAFLLWRLLKPGVRVVRRLIGRDPLPGAALLRLWAGAWSGLGAYPIGRLRTRDRERTRSAASRDPAGADRDPAMAREPGP